MSEDVGVIKDVLYDVSSYGGEEVSLDGELKLFRKEGVSDPSKGAYASAYPYTPLGISGSGWGCVQFAKERYKVWITKRPLNKLIIINYIGEDICKRYLTTIGDKPEMFYHYIKDLILVGLVHGSGTVVELAWDADDERVSDWQLKEVYRDLHRMGVIIFLGGCKGEDGKPRPRAYVIHPRIERALQVSLGLFLNGEASMEDVTNRSVSLPPFFKGHKVIDLGVDTTS